MHGSEDFFFIIIYLFFLKLTTERVYWKMKKEGNEKAKWPLGQNNRGIHWTRCGQLKGLL